MPGAAGPEPQGERCRKVTTSRRKTYCQSENLLTGTRHSACFYMLRGVRTGDSSRKQEPSLSRTQDLRPTHLLYERGSCAPESRRWRSGRMSPRWCLDQRKEEGGYTQLISASGQWPMHTRWAYKTLLVAVLDHCEMTQSCSPDQLMLRVTRGRHSAPWCLALSKQTS